MWTFLKKSLLTHIAFFLITVATAYGTYQMVNYALALRAESRHTQEKIKELMEVKKDLEARLVEIQTPEAVEREAKEKLNLKKAGESVVVVVPEEEKKKEKEAAPMGFFGKVGIFFKNLFGIVP